MLLYGYIVSLSGVYMAVEAGNGHQASGMQVYSSSGQMWGSRLVFPLKQLQSPGLTARLWKGERVRNIEGLRQLASVNVNTEE